MGGVTRPALVRREKSSMTERGEARSPLPPRRGGRCHGVTEGGSRSHEVSTEPPSAFGISPRCAGGEGIRSADPRTRSATPCGRPGREGIRAASSPAEWRERGAGRTIAGFGRPLLVADRGGLWGQYLETFISSKRPVTRKMARSQMLVARSPMRSRLWLHHSTWVTASNTAGSLSRPERRAMRLRCSSV